MIRTARGYCSRTSGRRRVVVTGMGVVSSLGADLQWVWSRLIEGQNGLQALDSEEYGKIPCKVAGIVPRGTGPGDMDLDRFIDRKDQRSLSLASMFALVAADQALSDAEWTAQTDQDKVKTGVAVGMGMVSLEDIADTGYSFREKGYNRVPPHFIPRILVNMAAGHISLKYGFKGINHAVSTACTTGAHAIGDAARFIQHGDVDVMVCGGTEASVAPLAMAGFARMRALSTHFNDQPHKASRPFDRDRDGFVMSEGAGILVLEEYEHARRRGARIYGEILGYGLSGDANHITAPSADGDGAFRCMESALRDAAIPAESIGYINAHATSTPLGDAAESRAITRLFCNNSSNTQLAVSSTKGAVGHLLGAAGSLEAIFTLMACYTGSIPPTLNCYNPDPEFPLNYVPLKAIRWQSSRRRALTNSFGFGGTNASLCISNISSDETL